MTSTKHSPNQTTVSQDQPSEVETVASAPVDGEKSEGIPAFSFPFSPAEFANAKSKDQPWYQKSNKSNHHQTPGRAPNGTRRSMGKR
ncbi:hypothetical protein [Pseudomonas cavernicola]|uniref:hypothetical protein n=1 Tax=Pseudomonas cavernicola TaxID=2320866 RepID=UPI0011C45189